MSENVSISDCAPVVIDRKEDSESSRNPFDEGRSDADDSVLVIDLDGTLLRIDLLYEALIRQFWRSPIRTLRICIRLRDGLAPFKHAIGKIHQFDAAILPYRTQVLDFIREQRHRGRTTILATASCREWAERIASHLNVFDVVLATDESRNLKGPEKLAAIQDFCLLHGFEKFDYIGDSWADLPILEQASDAYLATPHAGLQSALRRKNKSVRVFDGGTSPWTAVLRTLRPHQWAKNALLFVPLLLAHQIGDAGRFLLAVIAFISFSLFASGAYVLNDFLDVDFDRRHHRKRSRPFASGDLPLFAAVPLSLSAFAVGGSLAFACLPLNFLSILAFYLVVTSAYSMVVKRIMIADVMVLAGLYVLRVFAGGTACDIPISDWLLTFSLFIFVSLGFLKRYVELTRIAEGMSSTAGRSYEVDDTSLIETMGISCGLMSVVILALYLQSEQMRTIYPSGRPLWFLCPVLMYWLSRSWILARRRSMSDDPITFVLTDRTSLILVAITLALMALASA